MRETFTGLTLKGLACALPERVMEVDTFAERFGAATVERFKKVVGVERFHVAAPNQRTSDLAEAAAKHLFAQGLAKPEEIDVLLFVTQTPDAVAPATSSLLQARLGLSTHLFALDLNQGCAGFLAGLLTAAHFLSNPAVRNVLLLGGDTLSRHLDPNDQTSAMLFGDAGFAAVIGREEGAAPWTFDSATEASTAITLPHGGTFAMSGTDVFNFTITHVPEQIKGMGLTPDLLLLHQANAFILKQVARFCGIPEERVPIRLANRGNTSSASLPLLLCDLAAEGTPNPQSPLLSAFGVGLTWITASLPLNFATCLPPILVPEMLHD